MRTKASIATVVAVFAVVVVGGAAGPVVSQQPAPRQTISLFDPRTTEFDHYVDRGPEDISPGDEIFFVEKQLDPETCERAGRLVGNINIVKKTGRQNAMFNGTFTVFLAGGKIVAGAAAEFSEFERTGPVFAVTGGTETYKDASGEVSFTSAQMCGTRGDLVTIDIGPTP